MITKEGTSVLNQPFSLTLFEKKELPPSNGKEKPVYFSNENKALDRFYQPIPKTFVPSDAISVNPYTLEATYLEYHVDPNIETLKMPIPTDYNSKTEFVKAMGRWHKNCTSYISSVALPNPVSGYFYLPDAPKIFTREEAHNPGRFRTFKPNIWPLMPENYCHMVKLVNSSEPISPDTEFPQQIPKRDVIYMKHHITESNQWSSQLIPTEPIPIIYDSFEDYKRAYDNWAHLASSSITIPIPSPKGMSKIALIDTVNEEEESQHSKSKSKNSTIQTPDISKFTLTKNLITNSNIDYKKYIEGKPVTNFSKISSVLQDILRSREAVVDSADQSKDSSEADPVAAVTSFFFWENSVTFGGDAKQFVEDQINFGLEKDCFISDHSHNLIHAIFVSNEEKYQDQIVSQLISLLESIIDLGDIQKIIKLNFTQYSLQKSFQSIKSISETLHIISTILLENHIFKKFCDFTHVCNDYQFRASLFLQQVVLLDQKNELIQGLIGSCTGLTVLARFDSFVSLLCLTSLGKYFEILTPLSEEFMRVNPLFFDINFFYLLDKLVEIYGALDPKLTQTLFYEELIEMLRKSSFSIAQRLTKDQGVVLKKLRNIGHLAISEDPVRALKMLIDSQATQIKRAILGKDFLIWLNSLSTSTSKDDAEAKTKTGIQFIEYLRNSKITDVAAMIFLNSPVNTLGKVDELNSITLRFLSQLLFHLKNHLFNHKIKIAGLNIMQSLNCVLEGKSLELHQLYVPFAAIIKNKKNENMNNNFEILFDSSTNEFVTVCTTIINKICDISNQSDLGNINIIKSLVYFTKEINFCMTIVKNTKFMDRLSSWLYSDTLNLMRLSWKLIKKLSFYPEVLILMLNKSTKFATEILSKPPSTGKNLQLMKLLKFAMSILKKELKKDFFLSSSSSTSNEKIKECKKLLCDSMELGVGPLVCIFKNMNTNYRGQEGIKQVVKGFFDLVSESKDSEIASYKDAIQKHNEKDIKKSRRKHHH